MLIPDRQRKDRHTDIHKKTGIRLYACFFIPGTCSDYVDLLSGRFFLSVCHMRFGKLLNRCFIYRLLQVQIHGFDLKVRIFLPKNRFHIRTEEGRVTYQKRAYGIGPDEIVSDNAFLSVIQINKGSLI